MLLKEKDIYESLKLMVLQHINKFRECRIGFYLVAVFLLIYCKDPDRRDGCSVLSYSTDSNQLYFPRNCLKVTTFARHKGRILFNERSLIKAILQFLGKDKQPMARLFMLAFRIGLHFIQTSYQKDKDSFMASSLMNTFLSNSFHYLLFVQDATTCKRVRCGNSCQFL